MTEDKKSTPKFQCPKCGEALVIAASAMIPDSQILKIKITPGKGGMIGAKTVGGILVSVSKLMSASASQIGVKVETFIKQIIHRENGEIEFVFLIAQIKGKAKPSPAQTKRNQEVENGTAT